MSPEAPASTDRETVLQSLAEARSRTLALIEPLGDDDLTRQHDPLMSPIVWDLGHIAHFEEVWLLENLEGGGGGSEGLRGMYDPFRNPRASRDALALLGRDECLAYMRRVRRAVERKIETLDLDADTPLLRGGFGFNLVLQHEYQHNETILQTLQLQDGTPYAPALHVADRAEAGAATPERGLGHPGSDGQDTVHFPGGDVVLGTDDRSRAYDNERPGVRLHLDPFRMDRVPVSNGRYTEFVEGGGYRDDGVWSAAGRAWRNDVGAEAPRFWFRRDAAWWSRHLGHEAPVDPRRPVCHVSFHEAEAYASWAGKRLPTEAEWEVAAAWDPAEGRALRFPWGDDDPRPGHANLDGGACRPEPPGRFPRNVSPLGCYGMIGDVWEWTSSDFMPYPGYETFPYPEYSEVFFGDEYKVLRGGSWATRPGAIRNTFRNWDYPIRRQIFSGFRCAQDA